MPSKNYLVVVSDDFKNVRYCVRQFVIFASNNIVMPVQFSLDTRVRQSGEQAIHLLNNNATRKKVVPFNEIDQYAEEVARAVC